MSKSLVYFMYVSCPKERAAMVMCTVPVALRRGTAGPGPGCALNKLCWPNDKVPIRWTRI